MRFSRFADLSPILAFAFVVGAVFLLDRERSGRPERDLARAEAEAEQRVSVIADVLGNEVSARLGSLAVAKSSFLTAADSADRMMLVLSLDSVTTGMPGLNSVSVIYPETEEVLFQPGATFGRRGVLQDTALRHPYLRALHSRRAAASRVIDRRVFVFDPVIGADTSQVLGVLVAELDPFTIYRTATATAALDSISGGPANHALFGPNGVRLSSAQFVPPDWNTVSRNVRVADIEWRVTLSYPPPDLRAYRAERLATWITGLALALAVAVILHFLRRTITTQQDEISRRQAAEEAARSAAGESRRRAKEARDLAVQLEAAQRASQRLSTSLDPDDVVELFLGGVAEILDADVASLYTFAEEGEVLVGRRRMVFREVEGITERLMLEDIGEVRAPVALLPSLAEAVSTGEPYIVENTAEHEGLLSTPRGGPDTAAASVTVPLLIAGHSVGVASWEVYSGPRKFAPEVIAFSQALAAPAAAALRTAELFLSLEAERQKAAREALRFGAVLDQMADGVIVVDAHGRLERSNASAAELLGQDLAETPVDAWPEHFDLAAIEGRPLSPSDFPLIRAMAGEKVRRTAFIVRSDWGTERHLSASAGPIITPTGEPAGAAMVLRDVTDEHQYAEMLRHTNRELRRQAEVLEQVNQQLREATKAKDQFLAVMSHELRTPINAIMGYSDLLDLGVKGTLNDDQRAMLTRVRETSHHLLGLINEVLDLAKIGAGRMDLSLNELDVGTIVERAAQQILPLASAKGLSLTVEEPPAAQQPVMAWADETRLTQIIVNLMSNAVKFTAEGGIMVSYGNTDGHVMIHVIDSGPGIDPDQAERIFEEFYQVEGGLSRASGGTGLGLSIARRFARLMKGDIAVDSRLGEGSTFTIRLQSVEAHTRTAAQSSEATVVALVHNNRVLERLADELSGTVRVLGDTRAHRVVSAARSERPHLAALDVHAPAGAAWRTLCALQTEPETAGVPVLLFAHDDDAGETALELGLLHVLSKPLSEERASSLLLHMAPNEPTPSILIADEDADIRRLLGEAALAAGGDVRTAASGAETLDIARRVIPHVVVMDLLMPGMNGIEVLAAIRAEPSLEHVQIVALVPCDADDDDIERLSASVANLGGWRDRRSLLADIVGRAVATVYNRDSRKGAAA